MGKLLSPRREGWRLLVRSHSSRGRPAIAGHPQHALRIDACERRRPQRMLGRR